MKKFTSIAAVVGLLLATAIFYGNQTKNQTPTPTPDPTPEPVPVQTVVNTKTVGPVQDAISKGTLTLQTAISHGYVARGASSDVYATIDINAMKFQGAKRPPLNVSVVIDRSGSMSGEKLEKAKDAARRFVSLLNERDRVSVVSYGTDVTVDFSSRPVTLQNRGSILSAINRIQFSGGTNLSGGFERGLREVVNWKQPDTLNRVMLLSDGNATVGVQSRTELGRMSKRALRSGVSVSTFGLGLDYNEDIMTVMANQGAGNYYFIDNANKITASFQSELKGLSHTVARNSVLVVDLADGVKVDNLYGFPYQQSGNKVMISLASFHSEQTKNILLKLKVNGDTKNKRPVMNVSLTYKDVAMNNRDANQTASLSAVVSQDAGVIANAVNKTVIERVQQIEVATAMEDAMNLYRDGKAEKASALLNTRRKSVRTSNAAFGISSKSFDRVDAEMGKMEQQVKAAPAASSAGRRMIKAKKARSNMILFDSDSF